MKKNGASFLIISEKKELRFLFQLKRATSRSIYWETLSLTVQYKQIQESCDQEANYSGAGGHQPKYQAPATEQTVQVLE